MKRTDKSTTGIEWTDHTWNPFVGCLVHTAGCTNCYAMRQAHRLENNYKVPHYQGVTRMANGNPVWTGVVNLASEKTLAKPERTPRPSLIFVNSMSDFFHENALDEWRLRVLEIMARVDRHQYQVLTKRPENIAPFMERCGIERFPDNVWLGATVEHSKTVHRIDTLRQVSTRIRFLSVEPLITPGLGPVNLDGIHWVIAGGESGPGARIMKAEWIRDIRDQCVTAGVPFFFKQWGHARNNPLAAEIPAGTTLPQWIGQVDPHGKGGSLVDGEAWKQFPDNPITAGR